jgi:hypothetical protein
MKLSRLLTIVTAYLAVVTALALVLASAGCGGGAEIMEPAGPWGPLPEVAADTMEVPHD